MSSGAWSRPAFNLSLAAWRRIRGRNREPIGGALEARFYLAGGIFSALATLQNRLYLPTLNRLELRPPLFLVGHWRSGTTLLHELLALDDAFVAPSTYACFNPHHFLLTRYGAPSAERVTRPTGDITVSASSPQEEEFALLCMGATSPYEAFMFPSAIHRLEALSDPGLFEPAQAQSWSDAMTWILKATTFIQGPEKRLLVKSPTNSFRVPTLSTLFPGAMFIRLVREPCAVFASTLGLWQSMWQRYALTPPPHQDMLIERILETRLAMERKLKNSMLKLPANRVATIRYEDLVADPCGVISHLYERLGFGDPSAMLPKVSAYMAQNSRRTAQSTADWSPLVNARWSELFDEFGYVPGKRPS
ncbi:MAG TPA: sulfotransferase [Candidatus Binataceae bacterium]|nr:sulfotransferase [Candidatus Binataceae bacterium]